MSEQKVYKCVCGKEFQRANSFNGHKSHCKEHQIQKHGSLDFYKRVKLLQTEAGSKTLKKNNYLRKQRELEQWIAEGHTCEKCGKVMNQKYGSGRFCCKSCARSRNNSGPKASKIKLNKKCDCKQTKVNNIKLGYESYEQSPNLCKICSEKLTYEKRNRATCGKKIVQQNIYLLEKESRCQPLETIIYLDMVIINLELIRVMNVIHHGNQLL